MSNLARRQVLGSLAGLPLAVVLADPRLARAAAAGLTDVTLTTKGGRSVNAALALPEGAPAASILLVHEWWGLNDQIKSVAAALAQEGYVALAVDLYDGKVATERDDARSYMEQVKPAEATDSLVSWIDWLRAHDKTTAKLGTVGWCFGGGWSLSASTAAKVDATVVYYGRVNHTADELAKLQGPVLGHFATEDQWINKQMVDGFEQAMTKAGKPFQSHWYEAQHAFANPTSARYDQADADLAWRRTLAFYAEHLA